MNESDHAGNTKAVLAILPVGHSQAPTPDQCALTLDPAAPPPVTFG